MTGSNPPDLLAGAPWLVRELIEQAPVGVALFDRDLRYVRVNERLAAMNGRPAAEHVGRRPEEVLDGVPPDAYLPVARRALAGEVTEGVELVGETAAEPGVTRHWLESWAPVHAEGGEVVGVLAFVVEVTRRARAEEALRRREREARARAEAFADLATAMAAATAVEEIAAAVANQAAAVAAAAFSNLALLTDDGRSLRLFHHRSLDETVARRWTEVSLDDRVPLVHALRDREPVLVRDPAENARRYPDLAEDTRRAGLQATASIPLLDPAGKPLGALGFAWAEPQRFEPELQAVLRAIAQLAGQALERARLHARADEARERSSVLAEAATAIGAPGTAAERLQRLCERLVPRFADLAVVDVHPERRGPVASASADRVRLAVPAPVLLAPGADARVAAGAARILARGEVELRPDAAGDGSLQDALDAFGIRSYLGVPLRAAESVIGALLLGQVGSGRRFGKEDAALVAELGERVGLILDNVRLTDAEHEIAAELQQRLLPAALTAAPGTALAARYRAGHTRLAVGGDWYEVVARPGGEVVIATGDVVGRGPRAAAAMGQVRSALTATASAADSPDDLLARLDDFAGRTPDVRYSTVCVAFLDPRDGVLRYACAGHPPPVLLVPGASAELLEGGRSHPLGLAAPPGALTRHRVEARATVPVGGRLLLYTDGLVERRGATLDDGFARLLAASRRHGDEPLEALCDALLAELLPPSMDDDVALLCVERIAPGG